MVRHWPLLEKGCVSHRFFPVSLTVCVAEPSGDGVGRQSPRISSLGRGSVESSVEAGNRAVVRLCMVQSLTSVSRGVQGLEPRRTACSRCRVDSFGPGGP